MSNPTRSEMADAWALCAKACRQASAAFEELARSLDRMESITRPDRPEIEVRRALDEAGHQKRGEDES